MINTHTQPGAGFPHPAPYAEAHGRPRQSARDCRIPRRRGQSIPGADAGSTQLPNPYFIIGPALISFSGGRTSAYMLYMILRAHGGMLPADVYVVFANTGKEREETLRFIFECAVRWGIRIIWLERLPGGGFTEVGYNSASRLGEPFAQLIREKSYPPNAVTRFCTVELKIRVMRDFAVAAGFERWNNVIGLRYDEGLRVMKALARNDEGKERFKAIMPMAKAKATKRGHVIPFWFGNGVTRVPQPIPPFDHLPQGFDLGLQDYEGNCDLCFLKSAKKLERIIRDRPASPDWWVEQEIVGRGRFVTEYSYSDIRNYVARSPEMFEDDEEYDAECGLTCAPLENIPEHGAARSPSVADASASRREPAPLLPPDGAGAPVRNEVSESPTPQALIHRDDEADPVRKAGFGGGSLAPDARTAE